ncbi:MAG: transcriptional regulator, TetR family [Pseudonocardiales bacterium]|nr:transcriptional regulator, TetR family [Pseudonocardiales bacterium]
MTGPTLRADAGRNRERILIAAQAVFAERGLDASLEDIARRAGVGIATLYRRFPTRGDLITASFERKMADYTAAVERANEGPDAWAGFCRLMLELCEMQSIDAGLKELLTMNLPASPVVEELKERAGRELETLIGRAQEQGRLRVDFVPTDVVLMLLANAGVVTATHEHAPQGWQRYAAYMIDAVRAERAHPLPPPVSEEQMKLALDSMHQ